VYRQNKKCSGFGKIGNANGERYGEIESRYQAVGVRTSKGVEHVSALKGRVKVSARWIVNDNGFRLV